MKKIATIFVLQRITSHCMTLRLCPLIVGLVSGAWVPGPGNHPNFEKETRQTALGLEWPFPEQLSEFWGILGAAGRIARRRTHDESYVKTLFSEQRCTLGATLGIGWTPNFQPNFSGCFFDFSADWVAKDLTPYRVGQCPHKQNRAKIHQKYRKS